MLSGVRIEENAIGDLVNVDAAEGGVAFLEKREAFISRSIRKRLGDGDGMDGDFFVRVSRQRLMHHAIVQKLALVF